METRTVDIRELRPHPDNTYKIDDESIEQLAETIETVGLIELIYAREVTDGGLQVLSGHRRRLALLKLGEKDPSYYMQEVRVAVGMSDADALLVLHAANTFRPVSQEERQRQSQLLTEQVKELRKVHPEWSGVRTDSIIASMLGMKPSIYKMRKKVAKDLIPELYEYHERGLISFVQAYELALQDEKYQKDILKQLNKSKPKDSRQAKGVIKDYSTNIGTLLDDMESQITDFDGTLFKLIELTKQRQQPTLPELSRLEAVRDKIDRVLDETKRIFE